MQYVFKKSQDLQPDRYSGIYERSNGGTETQYRSLMSRLSDESKSKFQIICSRVREFEPGKKPILWLHDRYEDPENRHLINQDDRKRFAKLVFVSHHQFTQYQVAYRIQYNEAFIIHNAIDPIDCPARRPNDKIRLIYHTTPHRGLEILVPIFMKLYEEDNNIHLDVFSSFGVYGWNERDEQFKSVIAKCQNHPGITYHGAQPNSVVRDYLTKSHIFAYPSIWPETSCIAAIEAGATGNLIVCPNLAALNETVSSDRGLIYHYDEDINIHANQFMAALRYAINYRRSDTDQVISFLESNQRYYKDRYSWDNRIHDWEGLLRTL